VITSICDHCLILLVFLNAESGGAGSGVRFHTRVFVEGRFEGKIQHAAPKIRADSSTEERDANSGGYIAGA
jgi:hypothetical protein